MPNKNFNYRIIKARVAEAIIKELFQQSGFYVYEYGMERTMPLIMDKIRNLDSDIANKIRTTPDFVVQNSTSGDLFYLEVKYRHNGKFTLEDLGEDYPYKNAYFIVVSHQDIQWITYERLENGQYLSENSKMYLENCKEFNLDYNLVEQYKQYAKNFFSNVE